MSDDQYYPKIPGHVRGSDTSRDAAESVRPKRRAQHESILAVLARAGAMGLTRNELAVRLEPQFGPIQLSTVSARLAELQTEQFGARVVDSGQRRQVSQRTRATVWVLREFRPRPEPADMSETPTHISQLKLGL